jgi:hypothetical protein
LHPDVSSLSLSIMNQLDKIIAVSNFWYILWEKWVIKKDESENIIFMTQISEKSIWKLRKIDGEWNITWEKWVVILDPETWEILLNSWNLNIWFIKDFYSDWFVIWTEWIAYIEWNTIVLVKRNIDLWWIEYAEISQKNPDIITIVWHSWKIKITRDWFPV